MILTNICQRLIFKRSFLQFKAHYHKTLDTVFVKNLLLTNTISSSVLLIVGDLVEQEIEYQGKIIPERYEWPRLEMILTNICKRLIFKRSFLQFKAHYHKTLDTVFVKNLLLTNTISSSVLLIVGDLVEQEIEYQGKIIPERYEWPRLVRMGMVGLVAGPLNHYYYMYLDKLWIGKTLKIISKKILADQFIATPIFLGMFFYGISAMEHKTLKESNDEFKDKFIGVYMVDWLFWPPIQIINFLYIPSKYRVLYVNSAQMFYNMFLSYAKNYNGRHLES